LKKLIDTPSLPPPSKGEELAIRIPGTKSILGAEAISEILIGHRPCPLKEKGRKPVALPATWTDP